MQVISPPRVTFAKRQDVIRWTPNVGRSVCRMERTALDCHRKGLCCSTRQRAPWRPEKR
jgi:hypothetical protein